MSGSTETPAAYEERIAALEGKLRAIEARFDGAPARGFDFKSAAEKYGLIGAWAVMILLFGLFTPTMFSWPPYTSMLGFNAIIVVLTLGLIIPLTAGDFDLSVASTLTLSRWWSRSSTQGGVPIAVAVALALFVGIIIGAVNAFFIIYFRIHSLIVTLGVGYFVNGVILWFPTRRWCSGNR